MSDSRLKILLLGDYSNCHANLAKGLRAIGHEVTLMRPMNYLSSSDVDIDITRKPGKFGGLMLFAKVMGSLHKQMKGYDVVGFNDPNFISLKPGLLKIIFDRLRKDNKRLFYTAMSNDVNYLQMCALKDSPLKFSEFFVEGKPSPFYLENPQRWENWQLPALVDYQNYFFDNIDGGVSILYEYHVGLRNRFEEEKIGYGGIPVDIENIPFVGAGAGEKVRILLCRDRNRIKMKGSDLLEQAALKVIDKHSGKLELAIAENLPYNIFVEELKKSDLILDQAYSYTPATTALIAMAMGKTVVSGGEDIFYEFIGEKDNFPIVNASYDVALLEKAIEKAVLDKDFIKDNARKSRDFVEKHNDMKIVAQRFVDTWTR